MPYITYRELKSLKDTKVGQIYHTDKGVFRISPNGIKEYTDSNETVKFMATENIDAYVVVTSTGQVANSNNIYQNNKIIGIALLNTQIGFIGEAKSFGNITNEEWSFNIGDKLFLNGKTLSTTPPYTGYLQFIGTATSSNTIDIKLSTSILL